MRFCDLHTHILPGVDDGAQTMDQALEMLRNAVASDVTHLVVTPHCNVPGIDGDARLEERFAQLQAEAKDIPIALALGAEVRVTERLPEMLEAGKVKTLNGSRYLLTEFPSACPLEEITPVLEKCLSLSYVPVVAHPERYAAVIENPGAVEQWLDMGCHLQLTGGSILGAYGRSVEETARFLLRNDFVACVASDAHGVYERSNFLMDVYDHLRLYYSKKYAECLMTENPMRVFRDESL